MIPENPFGVIIVVPYSPQGIAVIKGQGAHPSERRVMILPCEQRYGYGVDGVRSGVPMGQPKLGEWHFVGDRRFGNEPDFPMLVEFEFIESMRGFGRGFSFEE